MEKETPKDIKELRKEADRIYELLNACNDVNKPNPKARQELQCLINKSEIANAFMQKQESIYNVVLTNRIDKMDASDSFRTVMNFKCNQLKEDLGFETSNQLERLVIEQIVLCWFCHHEIELQHSRFVSKPHNMKEGMYWERRLSYASRRYNKALELLSKMRKMKLVVQINNANNQIVSNK